MMVVVTLFKLNRPVGRYGRTQAFPFVRPLPPLSWQRQDTFVFAFLTLAAGLTRLVALGYPTDKGTPVFDEKHYVPQAYDMVLSWFNLFTGGIESNPAYGLVVHPPLAKQIIALGELIFGYTAWGWRLSSAIFGIATVLLTALIARRLSRKTVVGLIAGIIALCDGVLLVGSRIGMLDIFQVVFILLAAYCLIRDLEAVWQRLHAAYADGRLQAAGDLPVRFGYRWWRFGAGISLGLACGVKWSGLYFMAVFGLMSVMCDWWLRYRYRTHKPMISTLGYDVAPALMSLVFLPIGVYLWCWRAWFASETSVYRHALSAGLIDENSGLRLLPESIASWLYYQSSVLDFHSALTNSAGNHHPWESKPWAWLASTRPMLYYVENNMSCGSRTDCSTSIYLFGTPILWWLTVPVVLLAAWRLIFGRRLAYLVPLLGWLTAFVPWLAMFDRQMYFFYAMVMAPFTWVLLSLLAGEMLGRGRLISNRFTTALQLPPLASGTWLVAGYVAAVVAFFVLFSALFYALPLTPETFNQLMWLPSWR